MHYQYVSLRKYTITNCFIKNFFQKVDSFYFCEYNNVPFLIVNFSNVRKNSRSYSRLIIVFTFKVTESFNTTALQCYKSSGENKYLYINKLFFYFPLLVTFFLYTCEFFLCILLVLLDYASTIL